MYRTSRDLDPAFLNIDKKRYFYTLTNTPSHSPTQLAQFDTAEPPLRRGIRKCTVTYGLGTLNMEAGKLTSYFWKFY